MTISRRALIATAALVRPRFALADDVPIDLTKQGPVEFAFARTGKGDPGRWEVQEDSSASGRRVLAQVSNDPTDYRFPLAIYQRIDAVNLEATVRFKAVAGRVDRAAGLVVRFSDQDNYYVVRANALEDNVNLYCVVKGSRREIAGVSVPVSSDVWHALGLKTEGDRFVVSLDGKVLFTASDRTFAGPGKVGLWTKADSVTQFDALVVRVL